MRNFTKMIHKPISEQHVDLLVVKIALDDNCGVLIFLPVSCNHLGYAAAIYIDVLGSDHPVMCLC